MSKLLQINSSVFSNQGVSSQLADRFVANWVARRPHVSVIRRDLATAPIPHMDGERLAALMTPAEQRTPEQARLVALADQLIWELQEADVLVLGAPMYNFAVPTQLKAWFDRIARAGVTFRYTEQGSEGLLVGKRAFVFTSRGGLYEQGQGDMVVPYVQQMLNFIGITAIEFVFAKGLNLGAEQRQAGIAAAEAQSDALLVA